MTDRCAKCGLARREHHHDGAAYGVCGKFVESMTNEATALADELDRVNIVPGYEGYVTANLLVKDLRFIQSRLRASPQPFDVRDRFDDSVTADDVKGILAPTPAPAVSGDVREIIAMIIDPRAFTGWQGQYDNALKNNDADFAQRCADHYYKAAIDDAMVKADAILALSFAPAGGMDREAIIEECAKFIEQNQETFSETHEGSRRYLSPRKVGNAAGLAYVDGIRALASLPKTDPIDGDRKIWRGREAILDEKIRHRDAPKTDPGEPAGTEASS